MQKLVKNEVINLDDFVLQNRITKFDIQKIIKYLIRETNFHKLTYNQLKYIFHNVRHECNLKQSYKNKKLLELPNSHELSIYYQQIKNPIHRLIFETLEQTGLRVAELCDLKVSRINFDENTIFIHNGKGHKDRVVIFGNRLKEKLLLYLEGRNNQFLFESNRHTNYSTRRIEQLCLFYKQKADIKKNLTPHTFRHIWNTRLAEKGIPKEKRALLAGHSNDKTQDIYTHLSIGGIKKDIIPILDNP